MLSNMSVKKAPTVIQVGDLVTGVCESHSYHSLMNHFSEPLLPYGSKHGHLGRDSFFVVFF